MSKTVQTHYTPEQRADRTELITHLVAKGEAFSEIRRQVADQLNMVVRPNHITEVRKALGHAAPSGSLSSDPTPARIINKARVSSAPASTTKLTVTACEMGATGTVALKEIPEDIVPADLRTRLDQVLNIMGKQRLESLTLAADGTLDIKMNRTVALRAPTA